LREKKKFVERIKSKLVTPLEFRGSIELGRSSQAQKKAGTLEMGVV